MEKRTIGKSELEVSAIGLGCKGMSSAYDPAARVILAAPLRSALVCTTLGLFLSTHEVNRTNLAVVQRRFRTRICPVGSAPLVSPKGGYATQSLL